MSTKVEHYKGVKGKGAEKLERGKGAKSSFVVFPACSMHAGISHGKSSQRPRLCSPIPSVLLVCHTHHLASWKEVVL